MEMANPEVTAVAAAVLKIEEAMRELGDLELTMTGGGVGEVILA